MAHCSQEIYGVVGAGARSCHRKNSTWSRFNPSRRSFSVRRRWSGGPDEAGNFSVWQMRESGARSQSSARPASPALPGTLSSRRGKAHDADGPACQGGGGWRSPAQRAPIHPANSPPTPPTAHQLSLALHCNMCASLPCLRTARRRQGESWRAGSTGRRLLFRFRPPSAPPGICHLLTGIAEASPSG